MAKTIKGNAQVRTLTGTFGDDDITAGQQGSLINSLAGTDTIKLGNGHDTVQFKQWTDTDIVTGFTVGVDQIWFDSGHGFPSGQHLDIAPGALADGQVFYNEDHTGRFVVAAVDYNGDGVTDTRIQMFDEYGSPHVDTLVFLGLAPNQLSSADFFGG